MENEKRPIKIKMNEQTYTPKVEVEKEEQTNKKVINFNEKREERILNQLPYWDDGKRDQSPKIPFQRKKKLHYSKGSSSFPYGAIIALCMALVIGAALGYMILSLFGSGEETIQPEPEAMAIVPDEQLPTIQVEVIQSGAYSTLEKAEEAKAVLLEKNMAATVVKTDEHYLLLVGAKGNHEQAQQLANYYDGQGYETYIKQYELNGEKIKAAVGNDFPLFANMMEQFEQILANESADSSTVRIDEEALSQLRAEVQPLARSLREELTTVRNILIEQDTKVYNAQIEQSILNILQYFTEIENHPPIVD